ncbi:Serine carboxypeptidase 47, partial [Globisporangium polare]
GSKKINLQGIAIGNGWVNPVVQYSHMVDTIDFAVETYNITLITKAQREQMVKDTQVCIGMTEACQTAPSNGTICSDALSFCSRKLENITSESKRNPFDIREICESPTVGICYGMDDVRDFFNLENVREYLNVADGPVATWVEESGEVELNFEGTSGDFLKNYAGYVADLLDGGIRVLIYTGDADFMVSWQGSEAWTSALDWSDKASFNKVDQRSFIARDPLNPTGAPMDAGLVRSFGNLSVLRVFNAGHMVPAHQPAASLDMISKFVKNQKL